MNATFAYYPGCSLHGTSKEYDMSVRVVFGKLGIRLDELEDWICCGATPAHAVSPDLSLALSAKNLSIAESMRQDVAIPCAACFNRMKYTAKHLAGDPELRDKINQLAETNYTGGVNVKHILTIIKEAGEDAIQKVVTKKLEGLKAACYYGCLLLRPPKVMELDDPENPTIMESLVSLTGAEPVDWNFKTECCGAAHSVPRTDIVLKLVNDIIGDAKAHGADVLLVACPLCHVNLDMRQAEAERKFNVSYKMPVMYITQLLGLAMGASAADVGLSKLMVPAEPVLKEKNLL